MLHLIITSAVLLFSITNAQTGPSGQNCTPEQGDFPDLCIVSGQVVTDPQKIECDDNHDCCLCGLLECAPNCETFSANGDFAAYGVPSIIIAGKSAEDGAEIDCDGDSSCQDTVINGVNIENVKCGGDLSCAGSVMTIKCSASNPCKIECDGDQSCQGAIITAYYVESIHCSDEGCKDATFLIKHPDDDFKVECESANACRDADIKIVVKHGEDIEKIGCGGLKGCQGASIKVVNKGTERVTIEEWGCEGEKSCRNAYFSISGNVVVQDCSCSDNGCDNLTTNGFQCS